MERTLLTDRELEALTDMPEEIENPHQYRSNTRRKARERIDRFRTEYPEFAEAEPELAREIEKIVLSNALVSLLHEHREHRQLTETSR
jgi:hypothetical protein